VALTSIVLPRPDGDEVRNEYISTSIIILCLHGTLNRELYPNKVVRQRKYFIFDYF